MTKVLNGDVIEEGYAGDTGYGTMSDMGKRDVRPYNSLWMACCEKKMRLGTNIQSNFMYLQGLL